jgi:hypothetical protein
VRAPSPESEQAVTAFTNTAFTNTVFPKCVVLPLPTNAHRAASFGSNFKTWNRRAQRIRKEFGFLSYVGDHSVRIAALSNSTGETRPLGFLNSLHPSVTSCSKQSFRPRIWIQFQDLEQEVAESAEKKAAQRELRPPVAELSPVGKPFPPGKPEFLSRRGGKRFPDRGVLPTCAEQAQTKRPRAAWSSAPVTS